MSEMSTSIDQTSNKRVRVDPTTSTIPDTLDATAIAKRLKVPKARASATIVAHTATLLPQLSTILKTLGEKHLDLLHRFYNKSNQLARMEPDETIIPRSARLKFELSVPKCIEELPDFQTLSAVCISDLSKCKLLFRQRVIDALKIEIKFYTTELKEHLAKVLYTAAAAVLISNGSSNVNTHRAVAHLLSGHHEILLKHVHMNVEEFKIVYSRIHALPSFPSINVAVTTPNSNLDNGTSRFFTQQSTQQYEPTVIDAIPQLDLISRTLSCIFISPFDNYLEQHRNNIIELDLKKLVEEELSVSATTDAQMAVEEEDSASRVLLNELVRKESRKHTDELSAEIASLKQVIQSLKGQRGHKQRGASSKTNASKKPTKNAKAKGAKAAANANASSKGKKQNASSLKKKGTRKKNTGSKTGKNK